MLMHRNPDPWWSSPWVWGPALGLGAAAAAFALARLRTRADCSAVGQEGGVVAGVPYLERIRGDADPSSPLPMVVLFHSRGATPQGHAQMLKGIGAARIILPQGPLEHQGGRSWWPQAVKASVTGDIDAATVHWQSVLESMTRFLREISQCRPTVGSPIVTGSSQGGEVALLLASQRPSEVAGAVAVNAYLLPPFWTPDMAPTVLIHGEGDDVVPFSWSAEYAQGMKAQGAPLTFGAFPSSGHAVTTPMAHAWIAAVRQFVDATWATSARAA